MKGVWYYKGASRVARVNFMRGVYMNTITVVGRLTSNAVVMGGGGKDKYLSLSIADNADNKRTNYWEFTVNAAVLAEYFVKGRLLMVTGVASQSSYTKRDGSPATALKILYAQYKFLDKMPEKEPEFVQGGGIDD